MKEPGKPGWYRQPQRDIRYLDRGEAGPLIKELQCLKTGEDWSLLGSARLPRRPGPLQERAAKPALCHSRGKVLRGDHPPPQAQWE